MDFRRNRPYRKPSLLDKVKSWGIIGLIILVVFLVFYVWASYELAVWHECRIFHSWFYCYRILS